MIDGIHVQLGSSVALAFFDLLSGRRFRAFGRQRHFVARLFCAIGTSSCEEHLKHYVWIVIAKGVSQCTSTDYVSQRQHHLRAAATVGHR